MNICIITSSFPSCPDDVVQAPFLVDFIKGLQKRGHRLFVYTQDREGDKKEFLEGVKVKWFPWIKSKEPLVHLNPFHPLDFFKIISLLNNGKKELFPFIKENQIEACLALWVLPSGYFAQQAYRQIKTPYSIWSLGSDIYRYGDNSLLFPMMKRIIQEAKGVFADGFDLSKRIEKRFGRKCFFLATTRTLDLIEVKKQDKRYRFLFIGRLEAVKGIDLLLQSMALLKEEALNPHLNVVGRGRLEEWAKYFIIEKSLEEYVSLMGNVDDQELAMLYGSSDCVVIPSRSESIPLVFSEAIHFNKKMIVTDVGDMGMLGRQYGVAWVVPPEDAKALKEMMKRRMEADGNEEKDERIMEELKQLFNIEISVDKFLADYQ